MKTIFTIIVFVSFDVFLCFGKELPSFVNKCKLKDSDLNGCMKKALQDFAKHLPEGVKSMKIPPINPYTVPEIKFQLSWMNSTFTNFKIYNMHDYVVDHFDGDFINTGIINVKGTFKAITAKTDYTLDGKLIQLAIHGKGEAEALLNDAVLNITVYGKVVKENKGEYFRLDDWKFNFIDHVLEYVHFGNLVDGNPELSKRLDTIIMENRDDLFKEFFPVIEQVFGKISFSVAKNVFDIFSLSELFD